MIYHPQTNIQQDNVDPSDTKIIDLILKSHLLSVLQAVKHNFNNIWNVFII